MADGVGRGRGPRVAPGNHRRGARWVRHPVGVRWFTSDLHLGHVNVIAYTGRPFPDVGVMDAALVALWNTVVAPDDEVWVLGDLAMGRIDESLPIASHLLGRKHLVLGNHDRPFSGGKRQDEWTERYLDQGGFVDLHHGDVDLDLEDGTSVRLCHFPYEGDSGDRDRFTAERPADDGRWLLHGHVHEKWRQRGRMINVGVDAWAGQPVPETTIIELVTSREDELERLHWRWPPP